MSFVVNIVTDTRQWMTSGFDLTFAERKFGLSTYFSQTVK